MTVYNRFVPQTDDREPQAKVAKLLSSSHLVKPVCHSHPVRHGSFR